MPLVTGDGEVRGVSRKPRGAVRGESPSVWAMLPEGFFTEMRAKRHRSAIADYRWAYDNRLEYESMCLQWDGKAEGRQWERIYGLLRAAPGMGAITLLETLMKDDEKGATLHKVMTALAKGDDEEEDAKRERDAKTRFRVIGQLVEAGRPAPPWLDQCFRLTMTERGSADEG